MDEVEITERLVRLEMKMEAVERAATRAEEESRARAEKIDALVDKITRYESKLGGVFVVATAVIAFFKMIGEAGWVWLKQLFQG
jgi:hypothetical protein